MANSLNDLEKLFNEALKKLPDATASIVEVETLAFIKGNFKAEGFDTGSGIQKWADRKKTDERGRDITRYRTDRKGKKGSLNKYGRSIEGRAILVGHKTGGNKLRNSFTASRVRSSVVFRTYKPYAERHNEGTDGMPKRTFIDKSTALDKRYHKQLTKQLNRYFK